MTSAGERECAWCGVALAPLKLRSEAIYCSTRCRQFAFRFAKDCVPPARAKRPIRIAYADPPYPGLSKKYYAAHPDFRGEVDHDALIGRLMQFDSWALSTSAEALPDLCALCTNRKIQIRVASWYRGARPGRALRPRSAWEPVIYYGGRAELLRGETIDAFAHGAKPRLADTRRVVGAKPAAFVFWLFALLGARPGDELHDLFPGSGGVARAWQFWTLREKHPALALDPALARAVLDETPRPPPPTQLALVADVAPRQPRRPSARARRRAA